MKILQINQTCGRGSTGKIAVGIGEVLKEHGHQSYIAYGYQDTTLDNTLKMKLGKGLNSIRFELIKCRITGYFGFTSKRATYKLIRWIEQIKPDIIHLQNIHGGFLHIEVLFDFLEKINIPIVWTLHDCWSFTGHCSYFEMVQCEKWKTGCFSCPEKEGYPKRYFFDRSKEQYQRKKDAFTKLDNITFVTPSNWLKGLVEQSYFKNYSVQTIHNGINLSVFKPTESNIRKKYHLENKKIVLAVAASWGKRKGLKYVIELSERLPEDYQVIIIGLTEQQKKEIPDSIIKITRTNNQEELAQFYTAADVFVNCTLEDNFPTVNLESIACGTPVVTFDTGGSPECMNNVIGEKVPQRDINMLLKKVVFFCDGRSLSEECVSFAKENFDEKKKFLEYLALYERIVK